MTEKEAKKEIIRRALRIEPTVRVGKDGYKNSICDEIQNQLRKNHLVKVKMLSNVKDKDSEIIDTLAKITRSVIVDIRGGVVVMTDKKTWTSLCQKNLRGF